MSTKAKIGARIFSETNDLKRTLPIMAGELGLNLALIEKVVKGDCSALDQTLVLERMAAVYPIDTSDLMIPEDNCDNGVRIMRAAESAKTSRIIDRKTRDATMAPYYEYRDTAMSRCSPFKPEWIKELRYVEDCNPDNPDIQFNKGHFLHQYTFFIGPVNYYWEVFGKRYGREMVTGDSCYGTPFWPHTFANRSKTETAYILAITVGGDVRRAQKEISILGERTKQYVLDCRRGKTYATAQLIRQCLADNNLTAASAQELADRSTIRLNVGKLLSATDEKSEAEIAALAELLQMEKTAFDLPEYDPAQEVLIKPKSTDEGYAFPSRDQRRYVIHPLVQSRRMPTLRGFEVEVKATDKPKDDNGWMCSSLHGYCYNFGDAAVEFVWRTAQGTAGDILQPGDSFYMQPFVEHVFFQKSGTGRLFLARAGGAVNSNVQIELSSFANIERVYHETGSWF